MISVIVPYKNSVEWIERCVNSLKAQTGDLEFILVNDNSEDNGKAVAKKAAGKDKRFVFTDNKRTPGVSGARNTGLDKARGEWVTFLDADDELVPEASVVFGRMARLDPTLNVIQANSLRHYDKSGRTVLKYENPKGMYNADNMPMQWCMVWNKLIRRRFIEEHGIRFVEGLQYGEDEVFILELLARDNRIRHTMTNTVTVIRHFDNRQSLSRIKGRAGLITQVNALMDFLQRCESKEVRLLTCRVLSEHWGSKTFMIEFGEAGA